MSRDIRSFFTVKNTTSTSKPPEKKINKRCISSSSDDDIVIGTPEQSKVKKNVKKITSQVVSISDDDNDDDDFEKKPIKKKKIIEKTKNKNKHLLSDSDSDTPAKKKSAKEKIINKKKSTNKHNLSDSEDDNLNNKNKKNDKTPKKQNSKDKLNEKNKKLDLSNNDDNNVDKTPNNKKPNKNNKSHEKDPKTPSIKDIFSSAPIKRVNVPLAKKKKEADYHNDDNEFCATLDQIDNKNIIEKSLNNFDNKETTSKRKNRDSDIEKEAKKIKINNEEINVKLNDDKNKKVKKENEKSINDDEIKVDLDDDKNEKNKDKKEKLDLSKFKNKESSSLTKKNNDNVKKSKKHEVEFEKNENLNNKKNKIDTDEVDVFEERIAKKKQHAASYQNYLSRGGARNPGSKEIPVGAENCLAGLTFVVTGVLDSLERFEADELIQRYGGRTVAALSKKVNYLVVGEQAGESKLNKADTLKIKKINEDELLDLIKTRKAGKASDIILNKSKKDNHNKSFHEDNKPVDTSLYVTKTLSNENKIKTESISSSSSSSSPSPSVKTSNNKNDIKIKTNDNKEKIINNESPSSSSSSSSIKLFEKKLNTDKIIDNNNIKINLPYVEPTAALVEKYRPKTMKQIIGQQTDKSSAKKFYLWLKNWHKNHNNKTIKLTRPSPFAKSDDGAFFKACLLSGPPGIGKTTTVQVACKELGFDLLEFNASDTRSKKLLQNQISTILSNKTAKNYFSNNNNNNNNDNNNDKNMSLKHVLLMDEVDGMAGNEDRGGLQELIGLIKSTDIPIVCICNDRNNPKMRTLVNYTFDLRFTKPKLEQIRGAMMSLCFAEKIKMSKEDIDKIIEMSGYDIRQVINYLSMRCGNELSNIKNNNLTNKINKDEKLTPWNVIEKVFSYEAHKNMNIHDKSNLFFHDYNIGSLFVQENYLTIVPKAPKNETLERIAMSADSLSIGDVIEKSIRSNDAWSLLPVQACFSSVIPGTLMSGNTVGRTNFPSWLGKNSTTRKIDRLLQEITSHTRLVTGASKEAIIFDYLKPLRDAVIRPLVINGADGVDNAVNTMIHYNMLKDDLEGLIECSLWPGQRDPMQTIESKVKAAFTRMYNKKSPLMPYAIGEAPKKKSLQASQESGFGSDADDEIIDDDDDADNDDDDDNNINNNKKNNLEKDRMIKIKKPTKTNSGASTSKGQTKTTTRGRGRGRGRGK